MRVYEYIKLMCVMKVTGKKLCKKWHYRPILTCERFESEHSCWDPKDGDLCLNRVKPGETLVEARSGTDVQIVRLIWV
jgi:hypothetical protein